MPRLVPRHTYSGGQRDGGEGSAQFNWPSSQWVAENASVRGRPYDGGCARLLPLTADTGRLSAERTAALQGLRYAFRMPTEVIRCPECGGGTVTEYKPRAFVCGHCDHLFRVVDEPGTVRGCAVDGCGVAAVGRCEQCQQAFCTTHRAGQALCSECAKANTSAAERQREDARQAKIARIRGVIATHGRIEGLVLSIASYEGLHLAPDELRVELGLPAGTDWIRCSTSGWSDYAPWSSGQVARWFVGRARGQGLLPTSSIAQSTSGKRRRRYLKPVPAWVFTKGSTVPVGFDSTDMCDAYVFESGEILAARSGYSGSWTEASGLNGNALYNMAYQLKLGS